MGLQQLILVAVAVFAVHCSAQLIGSEKEEHHLPLPIQVCTEGGSCSKESTVITLDSNWRWLHEAGGYTNCYTGNLWDKTLCPDAATCTSNCEMEGVPQADWASTYGITSSGDGIEIKFVTKGPYSTNIGSRVYLLESETKYKMFQLKNREFTMDVDVSNIGCGLNGAVYFVEMDEDGGMSKYPTNKGGAKYGTGYCDAQCPHDMKYIAGEANCEDWKPSDTDVNAGFGKYGTCCFEMDIWEANSMANSFTPHPCNVDGYHRCEGTECGDNEKDRYAGVCDKDGCDYAVYRLNNHDFYGPGSEYTIDSTKPFTLITQFITSDGTDNGDLVEVKRIYRQDGVTVPNPGSSFPGADAYDSITDEYCTSIKELFLDVQDFQKKGGLKNIGEALGRGMVLTLSLWDDHTANMLWLDSVYPVEDPNRPGAVRGPCPTDSGDPADVEANAPDSSVKFFNLKFGPIGSTF